MLETNVKIGVDVEGGSLGKLVRDIKNLDKQTLKNIERQALLVEKRFTNLGNRISGIGKSLSLRLTAPLAGFAALSVRAFGQQARALANVEAGLKSTGNAAGLTSKELQDAASQLQDLTGFGDEDILEGVTSTLLTFTNVSGQVFKDAQQAAIDLSATLGTDLQSSAIQIGKALNDPIKGLTGLSRAGIQFSEDQKDVIKNLAETGRVAEAQSLVLKELQTQFGGTAEAAARVGTGPLRSLAGRLGDLSEVFGEAILNVINPAVIKLDGFIKRLTKTLQDADPFIKNIGVAFGFAAAAIGPLLIALGAVIKFLAPFIGQISGLISSLQGAGASFGLVSRAILSFVKSGAGVFAFFTAIIKSAFDLEKRFGFLSDTIRTFAGVFVDLGKVFLEIGKSIASIFGVTLSFNDVINTSRDALRFFGETASGVSKFITSVFSVAISGLALGLSSLGSTVLKTVRLLTLIPGVKSLVGKEALGSLDSAIEKLDKLSVQSAKTAKDVVVDFVAGAGEVRPENISIGGSIGLKKTKVEIDKPEVDFDKLLKDLQKDTDEKSKGKKVKAKAEVEFTFQESVEQGLDTVLAQIESDTLNAQRNLSGEQLTGALGRIQTAGQQSLEAIKANFEQVLSQLTDPNLILAAEQSIAKINEKISEFNPSAFETISNRLESVNQGAETDTLNASNNLEGNELKSRLSDINADTRNSLESVKSDFEELLVTVDNPEIQLAVERQIAGINQKIEEIDTSGLSNAFEGLGQEIGQTLSSNFDTFFDSVTTGSQNASEAFEDFAQNVLKQLASQLLQRGLTAAFGGGFSEGGAVPQFNTGGFVRGPGTGTSDSIVARLSNGEFVQRASAVKTFGQDFMSAVNNLDPSRAFQLMTDRFGQTNFAVGGLVGSMSDFSTKLGNISLPRFETGGLVDGQQPTMRMPNVSVNVVNNGSTQQNATTDQRFDGQNLVIDVLLEDIRSNGKISKGMRSAFGLSRSTV